MVSFDEDELLRKSIERISEIKLPDYVAEMSSRSIGDISVDGITDNFGGTETYALKAHFTPLDLVEEISENTGLCYESAFKIVNGISNFDQCVKNPPQFIHQAAAIIRNIELGEMIRGLNYHLTGEEFPFEFKDFVKQVDEKRITETPNRGVYDKFINDSGVEHLFGRGADIDPEVICFLKLPNWYKIKTPIGDYEPDFGLVMKRKSLKSGKESEFYFVIETKGTDDIHSKKSITESEVYRIRCALKHFEALGVEVHYKAPFADYLVFKQEATKTINDKMSV